MDAFKASTQTGQTGRDTGAIAALHVSVLLSEVLEYLLPELSACGELAEKAPLQKAGDEAGRGALRERRFLDGTLGLGGHAGAVLRRAREQAVEAGLPPESVKLLGLDRDAEALALARERLEEFEGAVHFRQSAFADFEDALDELGWDYIDGALVDLGVSSLQLDKPERGFSFLHDGPLDMRMNPGGGHEPASSLVNRATVQRLKEIIEIYGEEPQAGRIARAIDDARSVKPIETTLELAAIVERAYPPKWRATARNHPATRTFQALRLVVNEELAQLEAFLERIVPRLAPGGRVAVISFHSLEDRIVKHFFKTAATGCLCPPSIMRCRCGHEASLRLVTKKAVEATAEEVRVNSRSRSAKLRVAERTDRPFSLPPSVEDGVEGGKKSGRALRQGERSKYGAAGHGDGRSGRGGKRGGRR